MVKRIIKSTIDFTIFGSVVVVGTLGLLTLIGFIHWTIWSEIGRHKGLKSRGIHKVVSP